MRNPQNGKSPLAPGRGNRLVGSPRLYQQAQRRAARLAELHQLGALVASSLNREEILRRIVAAGERLLGAGLVRLWLLESRHERLELAAGAGPADGLPGAVRSIPVEGSLYAQAIRARRPLQTANVLQEPLFRNRTFAEREGLRGCLIVPLLHEERALGVLSVMVRGERHFPDEDVDLLCSLASYAALALENARLADEVGRLEGLREVDRLKAAFLSTVSHELRTPLSCIHGYAELLTLGDVDPDQVRRMAREIYRGSTTMIRLVDDLLNFSGLETGRLQVRPRHIDLAELLADFCNQIAGQSEQHSTRVDIAEDLPPVLADPATSVRFWSISSRTRCSTCQPEPDRDSMLAGR